MPSNKLEQCERGKGKREERRGEEREEFQNTININRNWLYR